MKTLFCTLAMFTQVTATIYAQTPATAPAEATSSTSTDNETIGNRHFEPPPSLAEAISMQRIFEGPTPQLLRPDFVPEPIEHLRIIIVADREAEGNARLSVTQDADKLISFFNYVFNNPLFPSLQGKATILDWNATKDSRTNLMHPLSSVRKYLDLRPSNLNEGILLIYTGHGASTQEGGFKKQVLTTSAGNYDRDQLKYDLLREQSPVVFLLTNMCSNLPLNIYEVTHNNHRPVVIPNPAVALDNRSLETYFSNLFLQQRGLLDITSSAMGELSWGRSSGSLFTDALLTVLNQPNIIVDDGDGFCSWQELFPYLYRETGRRFDILKNQHPTEILANRQRPSTYALPFTRSNGAYVSCFGLTPKYGKISTNAKPELFVEMPVYGGVLGKKGRRLTLAVYFSFANGDSIAAVDRNYTDRRNNVAVTRQIDVRSDHELIRDVALRIPVRSLNLHPGKGKTNYRAQLKVFDGDQLLVGPVDYQFIYDRK